MSIIFSNKFKMYRSFSPFNSLDLSLSVNEHVIEHAILPLLSLCRHCRCLGFCLFSTEISCYK